MFTLKATVSLYDMDARELKELAQDLITEAKFKDVDLAKLGSDISPSGLANMDGVKFQHLANLVRWELIARGLWNNHIQQDVDDAVKKHEQKKLQQAAVASDPKYTLHPLNDMEKAIVRGGSKIMAIKEVRDRLKCGIGDAKYSVDTYQAEHARDGGTIANFPPSKPSIPF
jgi:hypothetical protein